MILKKCVKTHIVSSIRLTFEDLLKIRVITRMSAKKIILHPRKFVHISLITPMPLLY